MTRTVLVLGTDHRFQRRSPEFAERKHQRFAAFVSATARKNRVAGLAEEYSIEALAEANVAQSTIEVIARELGLQHRYCDPDMKTRARLGILQESQIRISTFPDKLTEAEVQRRIEESMRARERYWLSELVALNAWPVLFICGANHSLPLAELLRVDNFDTILVAQGWGA